MKRISIPDSWILVGGTAIFLIANIASQSQSLYSHYLSWVFLYCTYKLLLLVSLVPDSSSSNLAYVNELGFAIANVIFYRHTRDAEWLTPLLSFLATQLIRHFKIPTTDLLLVGSKKSNGVLSQPMLFAALTASSCLLMVPRSFSMVTGAIALWSVISQAAVFVLLDVSTSGQEGSLSSLVTLLGRVSSRVVLTLTIFVIAISQFAPLHLDKIQPMHILSAAVVDILFWGGLVVLTSQLRCGLSALSYTYSTLCVRAFQMNDLLAVAVPTVASLITLSHINIFSTRLLQNWKTRGLLAALPLTALAIHVYLTSTMLTKSDLHSGFLNAEDFNGPLHPIESLTSAAQKRFDDTVRKQSKTLEQAVTEYRRRYKRDPPPRFDEWFALCLEHEVIMVDEFDTMMARMEVFWGIPPKEIRNRVSIALEEGNCKVSISNGTLQNDCWYEVEMEQMINIGINLLPDMDVPFNQYDEAQVVVPHDMLQFLNSRTKGVQHLSAGKMESHPTFLNIGHQKTWDQVTLSCAVKSPARTQQGANVADPSALLFIDSVIDATDLCRRPEIADQHGFFVAPASLVLTNTPVPIFSQGAPSTFQDILYPSPYYVAVADSYDHDLDIPYLDKTGNLYWAGSTTGGQVTTSNWDHLQRHRFVSLANPPDNTDTQFTLLDQDPSPIDSKWQPRAAPASSLSHLFNVKFTSIVQCDNDECQETLPAHFRVAGNEDISTSLASKLVIDLDGNGFSGRFYRLLRSDSVVLKQTVLREWHDDWLVPWVHYVPVSMGLGEVGEIVRFFATDGRGDAVGQMIARQGAEFAEKGLRREDMALVLVRLLMEYGRLVSDNREQLRCEGCNGL